MPKSTNKQEILNRLYADAVVHWNIDSIESLDPVVKTLIQGLASEIFYITNELENMKVRILNNLADTLTPANLNSPKCSHAIMQAWPIEPSAFIDDRNSFFLEKLPADRRKAGITRIDFTPIGQVRLIQGSIHYSICERMFNQHGKGNDKQQLAFSHVLSEVYNYTVWVAISLHDEISSLKNLSLYIDFPKSNSREAHLSLLPYTRWEIDGQVLQTEAGLPVWEEETLTIFQKYNLNHQTDRTIAKYYRKRFRTITSDIPVSSLRKTRFPEELKALYDPVVYENLEELIWIKIKFPASVPASELYNISLNLNSFPVLNKRLYDNTVRRNTLVEIIPLRTVPEETFLSVDRVSDDTGQEYEHIPQKTDSKTVPASYHVKQGGTERFDARDAQNTIDYLTDLLRSEVSAFASYGIEYLASTVETLKQGISRLESKIDEQLETKDRYYLLVNAAAKADVIFYSFWGTNCENTNGLGPGLSLLPYDSALISKGECVLLTRTLGGAPAPNSAARLDAFKYALISHDHIYTAEDIANFCRYELADKISNVEVRRGVTVSNKPKEGFVRCTDVVITPAEGYREKLEETKDELLVSLEIRSPDTFNYRIVIE